MEGRLRVYWLLMLLIVFTHGGLSFKITIVHNNDMHARYEPIKDNGEKCIKEEDEQGLCYGGFPRVATAVAKVRAERPTLFFNAGDTFQGSTWYTLFKGPMAADMLNMLSPDAIALGNHEFDDGIEGLLPFLIKVKCPVVCCNLELRNDSLLFEAKNLVPSIIITRYEMKIGVIGYLTPLTRFLIDKHEVYFHNEITSINAEASRLVEAGVKIIVALGHSGYSMDREIAMKCKDVDLVIGGHSHTFLYNGFAPDTETPDGNYPTVVTRPNGRQVPVVQAYAFTKYLGVLDLEFDNGGRIIKYDGIAQLLDSSVEPNLSVQAFLDSKRGPIDELEIQVVGSTKVLIDGDPAICRQLECNFGNLLGDAMVYARVTEDNGGEYWTDASIAVINAGAIRASIDARPEGGVTGADLATALPYGNSMSVSRISGEQLVRSLEYSASRRHTDMDGGFLQVSGIHLVINYNRPRGKRITSISVLCNDCSEPNYQPLDTKKYYSVVMPNYLMNGGDGYVFLKDHYDPQISQLQLNDREILTKYFQEHKIVYPLVDGRLRIVERSKNCGPALRVWSIATPKVWVVAVTLIFTVVIFSN